MTIPGSSTAGSTNRIAATCLTVNWWHSTASSNFSANELPLGSVYPEIRHELRLGMNADFRKHWTGWTNVSVSWGAQRFYKYAVRVGVKFTW
ncbi:MULTISPECIES: autotransporter outer membrane beta-barrel domain-containing protein [Cupriavidus]|uniref:autotransporter outer membrane beta-barrel domain-containing protein n=1 Tax=Cupriavidus TaxID=106589 RepID=UPI0013624DD2|nr:MULTISPECIES: autotransporter outer membrane beta-barrel domain-containing protein [Cupriavidus]QWC92465.1 autotransporter outer membrane beta-barrel domain-containing protein [Cupriavidus metallidurans]